jgi:hypothetical protein
MKKQKYKDYPFAECAAVADQQIKDGATIYQKWTCDGCGRRVTANNPNFFTVKGHCEHCDTITDVAAKGCNYSLMKKLWL